MSFDTIISNLRRYVVSSLWHRKPGHLAPIDGFRVLLSMSVIASHVNFSMSSWVATSGPSYDAYRSDPFYNLWTFGSFQVDGFMVLSGYLLWSQLIAKKPNARQLVEMTWNRMLRLWGAVLFCLLIAYVLGDPSLEHVGRVLAFRSNYYSAGEYPCIAMETMGHTWSNSLEFQCFCAFCILYAVFGDNYFVLLVAFGSSFVINHMVYDAQVNSPGKMENPHAIYFYSDEGHKWLRNWFGFQFREQMTCDQYDERQGKYMQDFYNPFHTRFGPFVIGCLIATYLSRRTEGRYHLGHAIIGMGVWFLSLLFLVVTTLPLPDPGFYYFFSVGARQVFASCFGILVLSTLVPDTHPLHFGWFVELMSFKPFYPLALLSYGIYVLHFRVMLSLVYYWMIGYSTPVISTVTYLIAVLLSLVEWLLVEETF